MNDSRSPSKSAPPSRAEVEAGAAEAAEQAHVTQAGELLSSLLENTAFVSDPQRELGVAGRSLVGVCMEDQHPVLLGRVRVHWKALEGDGDAWVPVLRHVSVRPGDQVLLSRPENGLEFVVVGVVDGFAHRPRPQQRASARLELKADEVVCIEDARGRPLLELRAGESGPVVRLVQKDLALEVDGALAFRADSIRMHAREGAIEIDAADDICLKGEVINLN